MKKPKKGIILILIISLLLLDYAALDDITTGNEPDYIGEYLTLVVSGVIFAGFLFWYLKQRKK